MKKIILTAIILTAVAASAFSAPASKKQLITNPTDECKDTVGSLIPEIQKGGKYPGDWTVKEVEYHIGAKAYFQVHLEKPNKPSLILVAKSLKNTKPLLASTKYFTVGFQTASKSKNTDPDVEKATIALADMIKKHESAKTEAAFSKNCSKPFIPSKISNSIIPTNPDYIFHRYDKEIAKVFAAAQAMPPRSLWSAVYVSRYLVFCPVVVFSLAVLLAVYVKLFSKKSI